MLYLVLHLILGYISHNIMILFDKTDYEMEIAGSFMFTILSITLWPFFLVIVIIKNAEAASRYFSKYIGALATYIRKKL